MAGTNLPGFVPRPLVLRRCRNWNLGEPMVESPRRVRPYSKIGLVTGTTFHLAEGLATS
jgi:hypothetical protein